MIAELGIYAGLFAAALLAATLLPLQSEAIFVGLIISDRYPAVALLIVATAGNVLGAVVNWWIGCQVERFRYSRWFPVTSEGLDRASNWYGKYGRWSLLLSWAPIVGDPLTVVAGTLREPLWSFVAIVTVAKFLRYMILFLATTGLL